MFYCQLDVVSDKFSDQLKHWTLLMQGITTQMKGQAAATSVPPDWSQKEWEDWYSRPTGNGASDQHNSERAKSGEAGSARRSSSRSPRGTATQV